MNQIDAGDPSQVPAGLLREAALEAFKVFLDVSRQYSHADAKFVAALMLLSDAGLDRSRVDITEPADLAEAEDQLLPGRLLERAIKVYIAARGEELEQAYGGGNDRDAAVVEQAGLARFVQQN